MKQGLKAKTILPVMLILLLVMSGLAVFNYFAGLARPRRSRGKRSKAFSTPLTASWTPG